jgi:hypothetical protein
MGMTTATAEGMGGGGVGSAWWRVRERMLGGRGEERRWVVRGGRVCEGGFLYRFHNK